MDSTYNSVAPLDQPGAIIVGARYGSRRTLLQTWLQQAQTVNKHQWLLSCDRSYAGPWAGLKDLFEAIIPQLESNAPHLLIKHDYELAIILPALRKTLNVRNPTLTDQSKQSERTRNWPADRAYRIVQGLIDLLYEWWQASDRPSFAIVCDDFDRAGALAKHFFVELIRRRGRQLSMTIIFVVDHPHIKQYTQLLGEKNIIQELYIDRHHDILDEPLGFDAPITEEFVRSIKKESIEIEIYVPHIIRFYLDRNQPHEVLKYQMEAFSIYNTRGFYEDALFYGEAALTALDKYYPDQLGWRLTLYVKLYSSYLGLGRAHDALRIAEDAMARINKPHHVAQWCYLIAMLYTRFLPERNFTLAEQYLNRGIHEIERSSLDYHEKAFQAAFNRNGLALIRHFQGSPEEAIAICKACFEELNEKLKTDEHKLHRSVLLYNIAQVYTSIDLFDESIEYLSQAMDMDPNYSEYYNDRGNVYLKAGLFDRAIQDYLKAIELSPPYMEVWTNLGQCYRLMGQMELAVDSYTRALDLMPNHTLALNGRADAYEELGQSEAALADYTTSLTVKPNQPLILANRAVLYYNDCKLDASLADLDQAIVYNPQIAELYQNRAVIWKDTDRHVQAIQDLEAYLTLQPDAEDYGEVKNQIFQMQQRLRVQSASERTIKSY